MSSPVIIIIFLTLEDRINLRDIVVSKKEIAVKFCGTAIIIKNVPNPYLTLCEVYGQTLRKIETR